MPAARPLMLRSETGLAPTGVLLVTLGLLYLMGLDHPPLLEPDETRYVAVARGMLESGDYVTGRINGFVYLAKPPLLFWLTALSLRLWGFGAAGARFLCVVVGVVGLVLVAVPGARLVGRRAAALGALVLGTSLMYLGVSRNVRFDMLLTVSLSAALLLFWMGLEKRGRGPFWAGLGVCLGIGTLAKGPVAVVLAAGVIVVYLVWTRQPGELLRVEWLGVAALWAGIALPWFVLAERANPGFVRYFILTENVSRAAGPPAEMHPQPWWLLLAALPVGSIPWVAFLPGAAINAAYHWRSAAPGPATGRADPSALRRAQGRPRAPGGRPEPRRRAASLRAAQRPVLFLALWVLVPLAFFSASSGKLVTYVTPCFPPLALLVGLAVARALDEPVGATGRSPLRLRPTVYATALALAALACALILCASRQAKLPREAAISAAFVAGLAFALPGIAASVAAGAGRHALALCGVAAAGYVPALIISWLIPGVLAQAEGARVAEVLGGSLRSGEAVAAYAMFPRFLPCHGVEPVYVIDHVPGDYSFPGNAEGVRKMVWPREQVAEFCAQHPRTLLVTKEHHVAELMAKVPGLQPVAATRFFVILRHEVHGGAGARAQESAIRYQGPGT